MADIFSSHQTAYLLEKALAEKKINQRDVSRWLSELQQEITALSKRIQQLRGSSEGEVRAPSGKPDSKGRKAATGSSGVAPTSSSASVPTKKRRRPIKPPSPEVAASRKLQGQYISAIRGVPPKNRAKFVVIAKTKGREAAIEAIKKSKK